MAKYIVPTVKQLRAEVKARLAVPGVTQTAYAAERGISRDGLVKFLAGDQGRTTLEFARKLLG